MLNNYLNKIDKFLLTIGKQAHPSHGKSSINNGKNF
jgi:hypothetical protein